MALPRHLRYSGVMAGPSSRSRSGECDATTGAARRIDCNVVESIDDPPEDLDATRTCPACNHDEVSESHWIRRRASRPRPVGPSTVDGKTAKELSDEQVEAIRALSPEELEAFADKLVAESRASQAEREEAAAWRHRMN